MRFLAIVIIVFMYSTLSTLVQAQYDGSYDGGYSPPSDGGYGTGDGGYGDGGYNPTDGSYGTGCNPCNITGHVYQDNNQSTTFNNGDQGLANQTVSLYYGNGTFATSSITDANGHYVIPNVPALGATYRITLTTPLQSGYSFTTPSEYTFGLNTHRYFDFGMYAPPPPPSSAFNQYPPSSVCSGTTSIISLAWTASSGASAYKVYYSDSSVGALVDNNIVTSQLGLNMTPAQGLIEGRSYGFVIAALNSGGNIIAWSNSGQWSHQLFGGYTSFSVCSRPGQFSFTAAPAPVCQGANNSRFNISWSPASGATTYVITPQSNTRGGQPGINVGNVNSYSYQVPNPVPPGEGWEFTVTAYNNAGATGTNGGSSYYIYGWITAIQCTGPGTFSWHSAPVPACSGTTSQMTLRWYPSTGATSYNLTPQTTNTSKGTNGWITAIPLGNPATQAGGYKQYIYNIPGIVTAGEQWEFTLAAINSFGTTGTTGGSTYYNYGWSTALSCIPIPTITFTATTPNGTYPSQSFPVYTRQNSVTTLNWTITGATSTNAYTSPAGVASYWNGPLGTFSGSQAVGTSTTNTTSFYITATNATGTTGPIGLQLTVEKYPKPYFQTTGGDVHTNENIYISPP